MRRRYYNSGLSNKPKKFQVIDGKEKIYSCEAYIIIDGHKVVDKLMIQFKHSKYSREDLDSDWTHEYLGKLIGEYQSFERELFMRDKSPFMFIKYIHILNKDKYFEYKKYRQRKAKLKRVL